MSYLCYADVTPTTSQELKRRTIFRITSDQIPNRMPLMISELAVAAFARLRE